MIRLLEKTLSDIHTPGHLRDLNPYERLENKLVKAIRHSIEAYRKNMPAYLNQELQNDLQEKFEREILGILNEHN